MLKKSMKILTIVLVATLIVTAFTQVCFADWTTALDYNVELKPNDNGTGATTSVQNMANTILSVVQVVGMAVAVIMLVVLAIKYISSAPSDKAEIKKHAVVYIVGAVCLFAATGILEVIKKFAGVIH